MRLDSRGGEAGREAWVALGREGYDKMEERGNVRAEDGTFSLGWK